MASQRAVQAGRQDLSASQGVVMRPPGRHCRDVCTVVLLIRPSFVLLAANRDERLDRPWDPPGTWWGDDCGIVGGCDRTAGGTWMGLNRFGVVATVLNRPGTLGPATGKRSRGELPLLALRQPTAATAAAAIAGLEAAEWRPFNMVIADRHGGWFVRGLGQGRVGIEELGAGVSMVTAHDPNDLSNPRTARHLPRFQECAPASAAGWAQWQSVLADRGGSAAEQINVAPRAGFGTVCSSFITLAEGAPPRWLFAAGPPDQAPFVPVFCDATSTAISAPPPQAVTS